ncbi:cell division protein FtsZ [Sphingomonas parva]|uniref:Cell division protein FtsZ n=1 Tax=Sphingomonas parva TaxID=2555898 RepID=A0A4Y8ZR55_9SPHN|nr:cell division protein FtsZ [Sphingomonas parva]TFI57947.1 cell division protein FtsZ [Sphingomonas parva]
MSIDFIRPEVDELRPRISVIGVGGAGGNAVANMIANDVQGVDFIVANTDAQALNASPADHRIQLGLRITQGLGAGSRPEIGKAAAEEAIQEIEEALEGAHMCFIAAGMGGGTGTGAAPVIAKAARDKGVLTVGVVTKPFSFEGNRRGRSADAGINELQQHVDTLIVIPNQNLFRIANPNTTFKEAFAMADEVLQQGVRGITDLMVMPGLINLDFADVRSVMGEMGKAMMGTGEASGDNRAIEAAEKAIANPLLDGVSMRGARGVIISITGGEDMRLMEVDEAASHIKELVDPDANIIWGSAFNSELDGKIRVSVVATGIEAEAVTQAPPQPAKVFAFPGAGRSSEAKAGAPAAELPVTPAAEAAAAESEAQAASVPELDLAETADELSLDTPAPEGDDELLLDSGAAIAPDEGESFIDENVASGPESRAPGGTRSWITGEEAPAAAPRPARGNAGGGTLFERMSNIARGADKAQVEEEPAPRLRRDPLDIPRFLGRQNNQ